MSGIFKGNSIYKSGGGGGGYKDGGELIDGEFIKVENNTVSSYDNVSRDPVNFYFEVKDGEVLNSVIELTTAVNATVYVYLLNDYGVYIPLGLNGLANIEAGKNYNVNIVGNSYNVEEIIITPIDEEYYQKLYNGTTKFKKFGNYYWQMEYNSSVIPGVSYVVRNGFTYYRLKDLFDKNNQFEHGYILPTWNGNELDDLASSIGKTVYNLAPEIKDTGTTYWNGANGNNSTGLSFAGTGYYDKSINVVYQFKDRGYIALDKSNGGVNVIMVTNNDSVVIKGSLGSPENTYTPIRFIKQV